MLIWKSLHSSSISIILFGFLTALLESSSEEEIKVRAEYNILICSGCGASTQCSCYAMLTPNLHGTTSASTGTTNKVRKVFGLRKIVKAKNCQRQECVWRNSVSYTRSNHSLLVISLNLHSSSDPSCSAGGFSMLPVPSFLTSCATFVTAAGSQRTACWY